MKLDQRTLNAHQWLRDLKASMNLNYQEIADMIGYSGVGVSKALKNETLSIEQLKIIASKLELSENFESNFSKPVEF